MTSKLKTLVVSGVFALSAVSANAATVLNVGTFAGDNTVFVSGQGGTLADSDNPAYAAEDAASNWVWDFSELNAGSFIVTFDLSPYVDSVFALSGFWGADNMGEVKLNGNTISTLSYGPASYTSLTAFNDEGFLNNTSMNTIQFLVNNGNPGDPNEPAEGAAFRATILVTATPIAAVPLPAGLPMLAGAIGLLGLGAARRRKIRLI